MLLKVILLIWYKYFNQVKEQRSNEKDIVQKLLSNYLKPLTDDTSWMFGLPTRLLCNT